LASPATELTHPPSKPPRSWPYRAPRRGPARTQPPRSSRSQPKMISCLNWAQCSAVRPRCIRLSPSRRHLSIWAPCAVRTSSPSIRATWLICATRLAVRTRAQPTPSWCYSRTPQMKRAGICRGTRRRPGQIRIAPSARRHLGQTYCAAGAHCNCDRHRQSRAPPAREPLGGGLRPCDSGARSRALVHSPWQRTASAQRAASRSQCTRGASDAREGPRR
jgi:hypothetical protein